MEGYDCFLSYSHTADSELASAVRTGLHRFAKPWYRVRALRVFRDNSSLSASPHLWSSIEQALSASKWLILLASPPAAASKWVERELETWCALRGTDRLLILLTGGELVWDARSNDFDWERTTALPQTLRGRLGEEPRHVDARWVTAGTGVSQRNPRFRDLVAELAASVHERPKDELIGEDVRHYRRTRRLFRSLVAGLIAFAMAVSVTAYTAIEQRNRARAERDTATSRMLAAQAVIDRPTRLDRALLLSMAAMNVRDTVEARSALLGSLEYLPQLVSFLPYAGRPATAVAATARGKLIATAHNRDVVLWDIRANRPSGTLAGRGAALTALSFNRNGSVLTTVDTQGAIVRWRLRDRTVLGRLASAKRPVEAAAIGSDGIRVALLGDGKVTVWDGARFTPVKSLGEVLSIAVSPDGRTLAYGQENGIRFVDLRHNRPRGPDIDIEVGDYGQRIGVLAFSPDGELLASGGAGGGDVDLWRTSDHDNVGQLGRISGERPPVTALTFVNASSELVATDREGRLTRWDVIDQEQVGELLPSQGVVIALASGPSHTELVAATADGVAARWDLGRTMRLGRGLAEGASEQASSVAFTPDGRYLAAAAMDRVEVFDGRTGRAVTAPLTAGEEVFFVSLAFDPASTVLAAGMSDGHIRFWDARTWRRLQPDLRAHTDYVSGLAFAASGNLLASSGADGKTVIWNAGTYDRMSAVPGDAVIAFGGQLASARADGRITVHNPRAPLPPTTTLPGHPGGVLGLDFSPDHKMLASTGADGRIVLWDVRTGTMAGEPLAQEQADLGAVAFSRDGTTLAVGERRAVTLWDVESRQRLGDVLTGTLDGVASIAFSRDGFLAWGSFAIAPTNELVALWDARRSTWLERACTLANRQLTKQEWDRFAGPAMPYQPVCPAT